MNRKAILGIFLLNLPMCAPLWGQVSLTVQPLSDFSGGWLTPAENSFLTTAGTERGMAYNQTNGHLYVTSRTTGATPVLGIQILDGTSAAVVGTLSTSGITGGGGAFLNMISVTDDGIIYAGNLSTNTTVGVPFKLYRWANESATPTNIAYNTSGIAAAARLGDNMDIIGSDSLGTTRVVAGYNTTGLAGYAVIDPINLSSTTVNVGAAVGFRGGISWVDSDTVWGTNGNAAPSNLITRSEVSGSLSGTLTTTDSGERQLDIALVNGVWLMATIETTSSTTNNNDVRIYDITDSVTLGAATKTLLGTVNLTTTPYIANTNTAGSITWGAISGDQATLYAMSTNNGVQAFNVQVVPEPSAALALLGGAVMLVGLRRHRA